MRQPPASGRVAMRRSTLFVLTLLLLSSGCSLLPGSMDPVESTDPAADEVVDFAGRAGHHTRTAFLSDARGWVYFTVYLPPDWTPEGTDTYPLVFYLHGQGGDEYSFGRSVGPRQISAWVETGEVPPFVLIAPRGANRRSTVQWYHRANERMLTIEEAGELRAYAREVFRAGVDPGTVSVHGQSRGATGALFMALKHPDKFASAVANNFVSDYAVSDLKRDAKRNRERVLESGVGIRMIGCTSDRYVVEKNRTATPRMHEYFKELGIPHEYEILRGAQHGLRSPWNYRRSDGLKNGLYELQFHARTWAAHTRARGIG